MANLGIIGKPSHLVNISYKFILKSVKSLNRIFWTMEYCFRALECQIWSTNTELFYWQLRLTLKFVKIFAPILGFVVNLFWSLSKALIKTSEYPSIGSRLCNVKFGRQRSNHFSGKLRETLKLFKNFLLIFEFSINLF